MRHDGYLLQWEFRGKCHKRKGIKINLKYVVCKCLNIDMDLEDMMVMGTKENMWESEHSNEKFSSMVQEASDLFIRGL